MQKTITKTATVSAIFPFRVSLRFLFLFLPVFFAETGFFVFLGELGVIMVKA